MPFLVLEWLEGENLEQLLRRREAPFSEREALAFIRPVVDALAYAHGLGIAHRDVKPANLLLARTARGQVLKVLDFGIAKAMQEGETVTQVATQTSSGFSAFSPNYGAPEQFRSKKFGPTGPWTDVHALGLVLVEMVAGRPALAGEETADFLLACIGEERPTPRRLGADVSDGFEALCRYALALSPKERPASAAALLAELDALLAPAGAAGSLAALPAASAETRLDPIATGAASDAADLDTAAFLAGNRIALREADAAIERTVVPPPPMAQLPPMPPGASLSSLDGHATPRPPASGRRAVAVGVVVVGLVGAMAIGKTVLDEARDDSPSATDSRASTATPTASTKASASATGGGLEPPRSTVDDGYRKTIVSLVRAKLPDFRACYDRVLTRHRELAGKVVIAVDIGPGGRVLDAKCSSDDLPESAARCIEGIAQAIAFPPPPGGLVSLKYPLDFAPGAGDEGGPVATPPTRLPDAGYGYPHR